MLVAFIREDPFRSGRWMQHRDGYPVHEYHRASHVWRAHGPKDTCIYCGVPYGDIADPSWERCPERPPEADLPTR